MAQIILFHDGCNICQGISATMTAVFDSPAHAFESEPPPVSRRPAGLSQTSTVEA
jgi:hypothetical protein